MSLRLGCAILYRQAHPSRLFTRCALSRLIAFFDQHQDGTRVQSVSMSNRMLKRVFQRPANPNVTAEHTEDAEKG